MKGKEILVRCKYVFILAAFFCVTLPLFSHSVQAAEEIEVSAKISSQRKAQLSWNKVNDAKKIVVRRAEHKTKVGKKTKYKKLKTLTGKKKKFTDKKRKWGWDYRYKITAYSASGKTIASGTVDAPMRPARLRGNVRTDDLEEDVNSEDNDESVYTRYRVSSDKIETITSMYRIVLTFSDDAGVKPTGYQVFRKDVSAKEKKFKRIATIKRSGGDWNTVTDEEVKPYHDYDYKIRSYKKVGKKTYYGEYLKLRATAYSSIGSNRMEAELISPLNRDDGKMIVKLTCVKAGKFMVFDYEMDDLAIETGEQSLPALWQGYSFSSNMKWKKGGCVLGEGDTVYIELALDKKKVDLNALPETITCKRITSKWEVDMYDDSEDENMSYDSNKMPNKFIEERGFSYLTVFGMDVDLEDGNGKIDYEDEWW